MAWKGYKKPLQQTDLWDLKPEERTDEILPAFTKHWQKYVNDSFERNMLGKDQATTKERTQ